MGLERRTGREPEEEPTLCRTPKGHPRISLIREGSAARGTIQFRMSVQPVHWKLEGYCNRQLL